MTAKVCKLKRLQGLLSDEEASTDVEYVLITALIVVPLTLLLPPLLVALDFWFFDRISFWLALPFP